MVAGKIVWVWAHEMMLSVYEIKQAMLGLLLGLAQKIKITHFLAKILQAESLNPLQETNKKMGKLLEIFGTDKMQAVLQRVMKWWQ